MTVVNHKSPALCNEAVCLHCGVSFESKARDRPHRFCSTAHQARYHRLQKQPGNDRALASQIKPTDSTNERIKILRELAYVLEDLRPPGRVAGLRRVADQAAELSILFDTIDQSAWALDELTDVRSVLEFLLRDHRSTLQKLSALDDLADDLDGLARDLRKTRRLQNDLEWAIEMLEAPDKVSDLGTGGRVDEGIPVNLKGKPDNLPRELNKLAAPKTYMKND